MQDKNKREKMLSLILALLIWQGLTLIIGQPIILVGPITVIKRLARLIFSKEFWRAVIFSGRRITLGFLTALVTGFVLGLLAGRHKKIETLLWPYMAAVKAVPVASFVVLCLIWFKSKNLSVVISFLMVLPIIYFGVLSGMKDIDRKMLEMATVFKMPGADRFAIIELPSVYPMLTSGCRSALAMAWKAGIAAEVIGTPTGSIGTMLYSAKIYFETGDLLAWTVVIVLCSIVFEKAVLNLLEAMYKWHRNRKV